MSTKTQVNPGGITLRYQIGLVKSLSFMNVLLHMIFYLIIKEDRNGLTSWRPLLPLELSHWSVSSRYKLSSRSEHLNPCNKFPFIYCQVILRSNDVIFLFEFQIAVKFYYLSFKQICVIIVFTFYDS